MALILILAAVVTLVVLLLISGIVLVLTQQERIKRAPIHPSLQRVDAGFCECEFEAVGVFESAWHPRTLPSDRPL